ncbi:hypothetical protein [Dyella tabacisoli]|uniref:Uncharacterized protein n=1 Tax=Dyella tabacisoli TaxID=2282381 RepID=A0A369UKP8_9GAMM|nr:hypothetical protein [Dyella tabacisoli]RDD81334.1 hypothetical protein DVJ77_13680 [Dyella tabacisoli]
MNDTSPIGPATADPSTLFEGFMAAVGISAVLVVIYGSVLAGGLMAHSLAAIFLWLLPLLILAVVLKLRALAKRGRQRAFNSFAVTMTAIWVPLIAMFAWIMHDIATHGLGVMRL